MIPEKLIIGAIAGDMLGSGNQCFTCNSVVNIAVMDALLNGRDYAPVLQAWVMKYPGRGYGRAFLRWIRQEVPKPYHSWNNDVALRVSPVGHAARTLKEALDEAERCAGVSHNHPDGIRGAKATASSVFLAKNGRTKEEIRNYIESEFGYDLGRTIDEIRPSYYYDQSCESSVPEAIIAFLESHDFESSISLAFSLGEGCGSLASITGGIAQAFYKKMPDQIIRSVMGELSPEMIDVVDEFSKTYPLVLFG